MPFLVPAPLAYPPTPEVSRNVAASPRVIGWFAPTAHFNRLAWRLEGGEGPGRGSLLAWSSKQASPR